MPIPPPDADIWEFDDNSLRYELCYTKESIRHPAKMEVNMCREIIKRYSKKGDLILDCMAGVGTTVIESIILGRNAIGIEYEQKFVDMALKNIELTKKNMGFVKGMGEGRIIKGDSRQLVELLNGLRAENIIFSPPFASVLAGSSNDDTTKYTHGSAGKDYGNDSNNIGNLKYDGIDNSIISSPPYEEGIGHGGGRINQAEERNRGIWTQGNGSYSNDKNNCGELRGKNYLTEMLKIYQQCFLILKNDGYMILVTKNFIKNKKEVRLDLDTIKLCEIAGFIFITRHYRKIKNPSFWIINAIIKWKKKYPGIEPPYAMYEDVLVFEKQIGGGTLTQLCSVLPSVINCQVEQTKKSLEIKETGEQMTNTQITQKISGISSIIFSPPYGDNPAHNGKQMMKLGIYRPCFVDSNPNYSNDINNIGNLKYGVITWKK